MWLIWHERRWALQGTVCQRAWFAESLHAFRKCHAGNAASGRAWVCDLRTGPDCIGSVADHGMDWSIVHTALVARGMDR